MVTDLPIIDAHHHFWDLSLKRNPWLCGDPPVAFRYGDYSAIRHSYLPRDYALDMAGHRVVGSVIVEADWDSADPVGETRWLHDLLAHDAVPRVIVAQAWLDRPDIEDVLFAQAAFPRVRGIRHKPRVAPDPRSVEPGAKGSMGGARWRAGYCLLKEFGLSFDLQCPYWHLHEAADLAAAFPETQIVINHAGMPSDRGREGISAWREAMRAAAAMPNIAVKISGLGDPRLPWSAEALRPIVLDTLELFGTERCMFATNYPVDRLVAGFDTIISGFKAIVARLPRAAQEALFAGNARRIYRFP